MDPERQALLDRLRGAVAGTATLGRRATGWDALDDATGGGLFRGALNEVGWEHPASGAVEALLAAAAPETLDAPERFWAWVDPARPPYPPALAQRGLALERGLVVRPTTHDDHLWALELILGSGLCDVLFTRLDHAPDRHLRRLQLAARQGGTTVLLFRPAKALARPSPAPLRLRARPGAAPSPRRRRLVIEVLKCRGRAFAAPVLLEWSHDALDVPALSRTLAGEAGRADRLGADPAGRGRPGAPARSLRA